MSDIDPGSAARLALGDGVDGVDGVEPTPGTSDGATGAVGRSSSIMDGLLETRPASSVAEYPDLPNWGAHLMIGTIKFINGVAGERQIDGGKPAVVNFAQAVIGMYSGAASSSPSTDEPDPEEDTRLGDLGDE